MNTVENEFHFLTQCPFYINERADLFNKIMPLNDKFVLLNDIEKAKRLQENEVILAALGSYTHCCFEKKK